MTVLLNSDQPNMPLILLRSIGPNPTFEREETLVKNLSKCLNTLRWLDLSKQKLTPVEIRVLSKALSTNYSLIYVDLSYNTIGGGEILPGHPKKATHAMHALSHFIMGHPCLLELNLSGVEMNDQDVTALVQSLSTSLVLAKLHLRANWIRSDGFAAIFKAIADSKEHVFPDYFLGDLLALESTSVHTELKKAYSQNQSHVETKYIQAQEQRLQTRPQHASRIR